MSDSAAITEGNVSSIIMGYVGEGDFLFSGIVCRTWSEQESHVTNLSRIYESPSRIRHVFGLGIQLNRPFFHSIRGGSPVPVFEELYRLGYRWRRRDIEFAAQRGRIDVLEFFRSRGSILDTRVLHCAVRHKRMDIIRYLIGIRCRFNNQTFTEALRTKDLDTVDYFLGLGCEIPNGTMENAILDGDVFSAEYMLNKRIHTEEVGLHGNTMKTHPEMVSMLLDHGVVPLDEDVDNCIRDHDLEMAVDLCVNYDCDPSFYAFEAFFERWDTGTPADTCIEILNWMYYDRECSLDASILQSVYTGEISIQLC